MIGLKEQTVRGAKNFAELRANHRWNIPADYNVAIDCLDRHVELRDRTALLYADDEGHTARYPLGAIALPISKLFGPDAIAYRLQNSSAKAILMEPETVAKMDAVDRKDLPDFKHVIVTDGAA